MAGIIGNDMASPGETGIGLAAKTIIGDKDYDSSKFVLLLKNKDRKGIIPSWITPKSPRDVDVLLYAQRHLFEIPQA